MAFHVLPSFFTPQASPLHQNPAMDPLSPYFVHLSENPRTLLTLIMMDERNYHTWACAMCVALKSKNKLWMVSEQATKLDEDDLLFMA